MMVVDASSSADLKDFSCSEPCDQEPDPTRENKRHFARLAGLFFHIWLVDRILQHLAIWPSESLVGMMQACDEFDNDAFQGQRPPKWARICREAG